MSFFVNYIDINIKIHRKGIKNMNKESLREILIRLRGVTDWTQKDFAQYFYIPRRTLQEWELGNRKMPEYLLRLMIYKLENENIVKDFSKIFEEI